MTISLFDFVRDQMARESKFPKNISFQSKFAKELLLSGERIEEKKLKKIGVRDN